MVWFEKTLDHVIEWKTKQRISSWPCDAVRFRCWANEGGTMMRDKWRGRVWLRDKIWCTMEVLIFDRSPDLLKPPLGLGFRLPKGLPSPCLSLVLFLSVFLSLSFVSPQFFLPISSIATLSFACYYLFLFYTLLPFLPLKSLPSRCCTYTGTHNAWQRGSIRNFKLLPHTKQQAS